MFLDRGSIVFLLYLLLVWCCREVEVNAQEQAFSESPRQLRDVSKSIIHTDYVTYRSDLKLYYDPPNGHSSPTALGVFVWSNEPTMKFYFEEFGADCSFNSTFITSAKPYIQLDTPFKASRNRTLTIVGIYEDEDGNLFRSDQYRLKYFVEASARPYSYGYMIPGIESGGYFIQIGLEMVASARAQAAGNQEFADFSTYLGLGTYEPQVQALNLLKIDPDLKGFEGGFPFNLTEGNRHYGILIPYHNGVQYFGKVVKINLREMSNASVCEKSYVLERMGPNGKSIFTGTAQPSTACVHVIDLTTLNPKARGFRRGFLGFPYGYLSPGGDGIIARLDLRKFGLNTTRIVDLTTMDKAYGGYSGGFNDGDWSCFNPYRTFSGVVGGIRSNALVDANNLRPYYNAIMICVHKDIWKTAPGIRPAQSLIRTLDFSTIEDSLRGFSDAIRVGRYAYLSPLNSDDTTYASKLIRINLGEISIQHTLDATLAINGNIRKIINILELAKVNTNLKGYSSMYTSGRYLILVPYRNSFEPRNGQRGHGYLTRLNMNDFSIKGVEYIDLANTTRAQIPSFADINLRGFSYGFPCK